MSAINKALKKCEKLSDEQRIDLFIDSYSNVLNAFDKISGNRSEAYAATLRVILLSMAADGKFTEKEYALLSALLKNTIDKELSYSEAKALVESAGDPSEYVDVLRNLFVGVANYSDEAAVSFACLIAIVLAIDDDVTYKEKKWMNKIF